MNRLEQLVRIKLLKLNIISWVLILTAVVMDVVMIVPSIGHEFILDFPVSILITVVCLSIGIWSSEKLMKLWFYNSIGSTKKSNFLFDFAVLNVAAILAVFLTVIFNMNNVDMRGWWIFCLVIEVGTGLIFSCYFALIGMSLSKHKIYTLMAAAVLFVCFLGMGLNWRIFTNFSFSHLLIFIAFLHLFYCVIMKMKTYLFV